MLQFASRAVLGLAVLGTVTSTIYGLMVMVAAWRFGARKRREDAAPAAYLPPVSVLKPLHGDEPGLEQNLRGFFEQDYPTFELLFCARTEADAGLVIARRLGREHPEVKARFLTCGEPQFPSPKVWSLATMSEAAEHETFVVSDADARVSPNYLQRCVQALEDPSLALASCLYVGRTEGGFASQLDAVGKSVEMSAGILVADMLEGTKFALGATMILKRGTFADAGGLAELGQFYAEDFVLGNRLANKGRGVRMSNHVIRLMVAPQGWWESFRNQLRWMKSTRRSRPAGHFGTGATFAVPYALIGAGWAGAHGYWTGALLWLLLAVVHRWCMAVAVLWAIGDERPWHSVLIYPLRDLMGGVLWVSSYLGSTMYYRGGSYRLGRDGRFEAVAKRAEV